MIDSHKRALFKLAALTAVAGAALMGCSEAPSPETAKPAATEVPAPAAPASAPAAAASEAAAATPAATAEPFKVAFAFVGPVGDGGWTYAHNRGRKEVEEAFGDKVMTSFEENIPEGETGHEKLKELATKGNQLIFGTTFGYGDSFVKLAEEYKDIKWEHATGYKQADNLNLYDSRTYEGAYMAGIIAGSMTKTNTLGVVASVAIPEVFRNINSYTMGAQSVNPKIKTKVIWVNSWFDPKKETEAAQNLIKGGADILFQNTDSPAVIKTAQENGKRAFGWDSDMTAYGPKAILASSVINWGPYYVKATRDAMEGKWTGKQSSWWGVKEGAVDVVGIAKDVPADVVAKVEAVKSGLKDGSFTIWKGPLKDQNGKEVLKAGETADDAFLGNVKFYIKGVDSKPPVETK